MRYGEAPFTPDQMATLRRLLDKWLNEIPQFESLFYELFEKHEAKYGKGGSTYRRLYAMKKEANLKVSWKKED